MNNPIINKILYDNPLYESRFKSILMIPMIEKDPYKSIDIILQYINENPGIHKNIFEKWFYEVLSTHKGRCYNTRKILERANLILITPNNLMKLTVDGNYYFNLDDSSKKLLIVKNFSESFMGFLEFISLCIEYSDKGSFNSQFLFKRWYKDFEHTFSNSRSLKSAQHHFSTIKRYLISLGIIELDKHNITPCKNALNKLVNDLA